MASESSPVAVNDSPSEDKAQELASMHAVTVEDVSDEELPLPHPKKVTKLDTESRELFPELGAAKAPGNAGGAAGVWAKSNGGTPTNGISRSSTPVPAPARPQGPAAVVIPGRNVESVTLEPQHVLPRDQLRKPLPDIVKDLNRKSRATIAMVPVSGGRLRFDATGPRDVAQQALKDLVQQIGSKVSIKVPIPASVRAHIIGRGGATIRSLQEKTGARIQLPKAQDGPSPAEEDDDTVIDVTVEGNTVSAASAQNEILKIVGERTANVQSKLRSIPAEFFPFIAGPSNSHASALEDTHGIQIRIPPYQALSSQPPPVAPAAGEHPVFAPAPSDHHISLIGDRLAVQQAREAIERKAQELRTLLELQQCSIQRGRHQYIIGDRGVSADDFFAETGCVILLPADEEEDVVTVIGPAELVQAGQEKAMDLAMGMQLNNIDIGRVHKDAPGGAAAHARNVTRYLRQREEIARIENLYNTHINTPFSQEGALPWELFSRDGKTAIRAQSEITGIISGHPPSRMRSIDVNPFYHAYLRKDIAPVVKDQFGVQVVAALPSEPGLQVLLVFEGPEEADAPYQVPRTKPTAQDIQRFNQGLEQAERHILDLIGKQEDIVLQTVDVPQKFHNKLQKFIKKEQEKRSDGQIPVRVSNIGTTVKLQGPASSVEALAAKVTAFVAQEEQDEKERDYTTSFDFPQKFANRLIGRGGSHISELRDKFDVEIQVGDNGEVEIKGPKAKADACKSHVLSWARALADETTHTLRIDPKFHRELIGFGGSQINRLQDRYKVRILFPPTAKGGAEDNGADSASDAGGKPKRQQAADEVVIRGPRQGADGARDEIFSLHMFLRDTSHTATVTMQQKHIPLLIGQGGMALDDIRQQTGARIDVPGARDVDTVDIQLKGTKAEVEAAKKAIEARRSVFEDTVLREIEVDRKYHRDLIGPSGSTLRTIIVDAGGSDDRREMSRTIQFPRQESDGNMIKIEGRSSVVDKIVAKIEEIVSEKQNQVVDIIDVPIEKHRALIGRGGDVKRKLEAQFSVGIDIPRQGDTRTGVKLTGRSENVEKAKAHIADMVKEQQGETIQVPRRLHAAMSNNGQFFRKLSRDLHVSVDHAGHTVPQKPGAAANQANGGALPLITDDDEAVDAHSWNVVDNTSTEEGDIPWVLRGSPENVEKAKAAIEQARKEAEKDNVVGYLVLSDSKLYRHVIGSNGSKVNSIRKQSGCKITVPRDQARDDGIEVVGSLEGVEKAKDLILDAVREGATRPPRERW
jgi:polyribonucleotide nucleotidyltransferase